jgi:enoyl-CoA hydratase
VLSQHIDEILREAGYGDGHPAAHGGRGEVSAGVSVRVQGPVATVTLGDGTRQNALGDEGWAELGDAFRRLAGEESLRAVVLAGEGSSFSSGFDMRAWVGATPESVEESFALMEAACTAIEELPVPVVAKVNGIAAGAGCQVALACDLRVFGKRALTGMPIARWGILVSPSFATRLSLLGGPGFARDLLYTGRLIGTAEAASHGLVTRSAPEQRLDAAVDGLMRSLIAHPPEAIRAAKRAVEAGLAPAIAAARSADAGPVVTYAQFQQRVTEFLNSEDSGP